METMNITNSMRVREEVGKIQEAMRLAEDPAGEAKTKRMQIRISLPMRSLMLQSISSKEPEQQSNTIKESTCNKKEFPSTHDVEKGTHDQGTDEADNREGQHVEADLILLELELGAEDIWVLVVDEVEKKSLCENKGKTYDELPSMLCEAFLQQSQDLTGIGAKGPTRSFVSLLFFHQNHLLQKNPAFVNCLNDCFHNRAGFFFAGLQEEPSRTLRNVLSHDEQGCDADPAQKEHGPPVGFMDQKSEERSHGASEVPGPVDADVDPSSVVGRHELIDSSEDGSELPAYTTLIKGNLSPVMNLARTKVAGLI